MPSSSMMRRGAASPPGAGVNRLAQHSSRRLNLQICRVTNTSEEIYKNLGMKMPTGDEEMLEAGLSRLRMGAWRHGDPTPSLPLCRCPSIKRKCSIPSLVVWRLESASFIWTNCLQVNIISL